jgi:hypothetical protein
MVRDNLRQLIIICHADHRNQVYTASHRVYLADAFNIYQRFRDLVNRSFDALNQDNG